MELELDHALEAFAEPDLQADRENLCHRAWRKVILAVEQSLQALHPDFTVCGPFGFELGLQADKAPKHIRKFYIYVNNPESDNIDVLAKRVEQLTLQQIQNIYPAIYDDFVAMICNQNLELKKENTYQCKPTDKLLDIQVRDITTPIIDDYADYVISVFQSILTKTGEARNYPLSHLCRSRMFQLYVMLVKLYAPFMATDMSYEKAFHLILPLIDNHIQIFFTPIRDRQRPITAEEQDIINQYVIPLCHAIEKLLIRSCETDKSMVLITKPYHIIAPEDLHINIGEKLYSVLRQAVIISYNRFID